MGEWGREGRKGGREEQEMKTGSYNKEFVQEDWSSIVLTHITTCVGLFLLFCYVEVCKRMKQTFAAVESEDVSYQLKC